MDPARLARKLEDPERDLAAKPAEVLAALHLAPGQVIGDIGAGTGYFSLRLAREVGPEGRLFAVEVEPYLLDRLRRAAAETGAENIVPVLAPPDDSLLAEASCDLLFLHHVYTHFVDRVGYLRHLRTRLKPGGRIAIIGWRRGRRKVEPRHAAPDEIALTTEQVVDELRAAGFSLQENLELVPDKYFLIAAAPP